MEAIPSFCIEWGTEQTLIHPPTFFLMGYGAGTHIRTKFGVKPSIALLENKRWDGK